MLALQFDGLFAPLHPHPLQGVQGAVGELRCSVSGVGSDLLYRASHSTHDWVQD
ncbi:hypothetical protein GQ42DRAFT_165447, partial [Ramicandelaber brevisporus]